MSNNALVQASNETDELKAIAINNTDDSGMSKVDQNAATTAEVKESVEDRALKVLCQRAAEGTDF